jgi:hypothetical protein
VTHSLIGQFMRNHYRARLAASDVQTVARQMRKQGWPLWIAVACLATR